ncbi:hypothetical protein ACFFRR_007311 [Megaselia abdita]
MKKVLVVIVLVATTLLPTVVHFADCCSSKVLLKKYQEQVVDHDGEIQDKSLIDEVKKHYAVIDNIRHSKCPDQLQKFYCLNEGRCFNYKIGNYDSYACECKDEFHGERCEYKYVINHINIGNDSFTDYQLMRKSISGGGGLKIADLRLAPLLVAVTAILFIIFLVKKKIIQNCKNHTTISDGSRRRFQFGLNNNATHQCRYNCS